MSGDKRLFVLLCVSGLLATTLAKGQDLALPGPTSIGSPPPLGYEISAYELAPRFQCADQAWSPAEARALLAERVAAEKQRRELNVYYYRIGHTLAFPLPLTNRPDEQTLPQGIEKISYPWLTWLAWELESRWRTLHAGWRQLGDVEAGQVLQRELAALAQWQSFVGEGKRVSLVTGHLAACLALALADPVGWEPELWESALSASRALLDRDVQPWFAQLWGDDKPLTPARLHNIPTIAMIRSAQLARVIDSPLRDRLESRAGDALRAWWRYRSGPERHTEGTAYDGYLHVALDLTGSYADLPADAGVRRDVWLVPAASAVVVRDTFAGLRENVEVRTHWLGATHLAWAFPQGAARLSDGERALWIVSAPRSIEPTGLIRHPGSRGPLTLEHVTTLPQGAGTHWWVFRCDASSGWDPPQVTVDEDVLRVRFPQQPEQTWSVP